MDENQERGGAWLHVSAKWEISPFYGLVWSSSTKVSLIEEADKKAVLSDF